MRPSENKQFLSDRKDKFCKFYNILIARLFDAEK